MTITAGDSLLSRLFLTNSTTESRREHYLCSTTLALGQLGAAAATPEVLTALLHLLADADADISTRGVTVGALGQLGAAAATPEVLTALLHLLADAAANVRRAAARALGQLGAAAATPEVLTALLHTLADADTGVRYATASALQRLSGYVRLPDRSATVQLLLPLTPSNQWC
jgi:HEAT repeat protein